MLDLYLTRITFWITRIGFRRSFDPDKPKIHALQRKLAAGWFEGLKRLGVLALLATAGKHSKLAQGLYLVSLIIFISPVSTWLEQFELDLRKPSADSPEEPANTGWANSLVPAIVWGLALAVLFFGSQLIAAAVTQELVAAKDAEASNGRSSPAARAGRPRLLSRGTEGRADAGGQGEGE